MLPHIRSSKLRDFRLLHKVETETSCSPVSQRKGVVFVAKLWTFFTQSLTAESWSSPVSYCGANSLLDFKSRWIFIKNTFILMGQYFIKFLILHICCKGFLALSSINSLFRKTHTHKKPFVNWDFSWCYRGRFFPPLIAVFFDDKARYVLGRACHMIEECLSVSQSNLSHASGVCF